MAGIRRGSDVVKVLCSYTLPGCSSLRNRKIHGDPGRFLGEEGAAHVLEIFRREIDRDMALMGLRQYWGIEFDLILRHPSTSGKLVRPLSYRRQSRPPLRVRRLSYGWLTVVPKSNLESMSRFPLMTPLAILTGRSLLQERLIRQQMKRPPNPGCGTRQLL